jgi:hypothetical protein
MSRIAARIRVVYRVQPRPPPSHYGSMTRSEAVSLFDLSPLLTRLRHSRRAVRGRKARLATGVHRVRAKSDGPLASHACLLLEALGLCQFRGLHTEMVRLREVVVRFAAL